MCDPVSLTLGAVAGSQLYAADRQSSAARKAREASAAQDPAKETAEAEARALQSANRELAATRERRRQQSLLMAGAPAPTYGEQSDPSALLKVGEVSRGSIRPPDSLMSRGRM